MGLLIQIIFCSNLCYVSNGSYTAFSMINDKEKKTFEVLLFYGGYQPVLTVAYPVVVGTVEINF